MILINLYLFKNTMLKLNILEDYTQILRLSLVNYSLDNM